MRTPRTAYAIYRSDKDLFWQAVGQRHSWETQPHLYDTLEKAQRVIPRIKGRSVNFRWEEQWEDYGHLVEIVCIQYGIVRVTLRNEG